MAHLRQVYTVHWGAGGKNELGTIREIKNELRRKNIDEKAKDVYECERLLEITVAANVLSMACINCGAKSLEELSRCLQDWESLDRLLGKITDNLNKQNLCMSRYGNLLAQDMVLKNCYALTNDGISHMEYLRALKAGDIGAILKIIDMWTVGFCASTATGQYAREFLLLASNLKHQGSEELRDMLLDHWICNPSARAGKFVEADLDQENHNRFEKAIYGGKTFPKVSFLQECVSVNIPMLRDHVIIVEHMFRTYISSSHTYKSKMDDIQALVGLFLFNIVHAHVSGRTLTFEALNIWESGLERLPEEIEKWKKIQRESTQPDTFNEGEEEIGIDDQFNVEESEEALEQVFEEILS